MPHPERATIPPMTKRTRAVAPPPEGSDEVTSVRRTLRMVADVDIELRDGDRGPLDPCGARRRPGLARHPPDPRRRQGRGGRGLEGLHLTGSRATDRDPVPAASRPVRVIEHRGAFRPFQA